MLNVQKYLKENSLESLTENFGIVISDYPDRIVLNYSVIESPKNHPICDECRALILSKPDFEILSISFKRFYNFGEDVNSGNFDINKSICMEKVDGSLAVVYNDGHQWNVQTRKMAFAEGETRLGNTYKDVFCKALGGDNLNDIFKLFDTDLCFVFELVSPETRVVKPYEGYNLYPLAVKNKKTLKEECFGLKEKYFSDNPNILEPKTYEFKSLDQILSNFKEIPAFDEGYVCLIEDVNNWRIKIKNPAYLAIAHLRDNGAISTKRIIKLVFEQDYEEYLLNFPEDREFFDPYIEAYDRMISLIHELWSEYGEIQNQKDFAMKVKDLPVAGILFQLKKGLTLTEIFDKMTENYRENLIERMKDERIG